MNSFKLTAVGDALCSEKIYKSFENNGRYDFSGLLSELTIDENNLNYYNQESLIGGKNLGLCGSISKQINNHKQAHFNSPHEFAEEIIKNNFNMVSLSNNHTLDKNIMGVKHSLNFWKDKGVITAGSYKEYNDDIILNHIHEKNGIKFAFFSYTTKINSKYNYNNLPYLRHDFNYQSVKHDIELVKDKVDLIIVAMHWGNEY